MIISFLYFTAIKVFVTHHGYLAKSKRVIYVSTVVLEKLTFYFIRLSKKPLTSSGAACFLVEALDIVELRRDGLIGFASPPAGSAPAARILSAALIGLSPAPAAKSVAASKEAAPELCVRFGTDCAAAATAQQNTI